MSELVGELLNPYVEAADSGERTEVMSTEELLCHEREKLNKTILRAGAARRPFQQAGGLIVGSIDVQSFYPEIDIDVVAEEAKKGIMESEVEV